MQIDPKELAAVTAAAAPRFDMYTPIHKAIRALMADTLTAVGRMDVTDDLEFAQVTERVMQLLDFCRSHLSHENEFIHTAMEARAPGTSGHIADDHVQHQQHIAELAVSVAGLRACEPALRPALAQSLYRELALFIAGNFEHMHFEETAHNTVLWTRYSDAELLAVHEALVSSLPPAELMFSMRWLVPFLSPAERAGLVGGMRAKMPAPAFDAVMEMVRPHLAQREWEKLARDVGIEAGW